jgi:hemolysin activation/secretion protein
MVNCAALAFMSASTRTVGSASTPTESVVTRQAQEERDRMLQQQQQQQQQQQLVPPTDSGVQIQVLPTEGAEGTQPQSGDDAGK